MQNIYPQVCQFVGYWGYGNQENLDKTLSQILSAAPGAWKTAQRLVPNNFIKQKKQYLSQIGCFGVNTNSSKVNSNNSIYVTVSTDGLRDSADAWVKIDPLNHLTLGREAFGRVPLYWTQTEEVIWFASQLQLLLPIIENPQVSIAGLYGYSCFSYIPTPLTPVNHIFAIPAGTQLIWQTSNELKISSQPTQERLLEWRESSNLIADEATAISQLQTLLKNAIQRQIADLNSEPVGVLLSGGLDSAIVAAHLVQAGVNVRAYTLDFGDVGIPELPYAEQVAQFLNIPLVKVAATQDCIRKSIIHTAQALDLPFGDSVTVPLFLLAQAASQETKVIFNGEGGDQLFAGWTNKPLIAAEVYNTVNPTGKENFSSQYLRTFHRLYGYESQIFQPAVYEQVQQINPEYWLEAALDPSFSTSVLHRLRRATLMLKGAQNIHPRATNIAFAHKLKVRSPFCDLSLAEWTFQLSGKLCLQGSCEKYILKRAVENLLPPEIVWREKRGMEVPLTYWCLNQLWGFVGTWLNPGKLRAEKIWQPHLAAHIVAGDIGATIKSRRLGEMLWLLIMWEVWRTTVLGEESNNYAWDHPFWFPRQLWSFSRKWKD
ncbi:MAG TPA: asparagine synthetase B family protein [Oculatellaceae cyanobacterium]|jgi:asparagine synthase (glutamine-hydrolysing)